MKSLGGLRQSAALLVLGLLMAPVGAWGQCTTVDELPLPASELLEVGVEKVAVAKVTTEQIELTLTLGLRAQKGLRLHQVTFEKLRVNELPFYVDPVLEELKLKEGEPAELALKLTLYYRDLDSLRPLRLLLSESRIRLEGTAYLDVKLGALHQVLTLSRRARVPVTLREELALEIPGGEPVRQAALQMRSSAAAALETAGEAVETGLTWTSRWRRELWENYAPRVLLAYLQFGLRGKEDRVVRFECFGAGFRIGPDQFILPKELVHPWKFDPEIAGVLKREGLRLDAESYDLWVWPANARMRDAEGELDPTSAFRLRAGQLRLVRTPEDDDIESVWVPQPEGRPQKIKLHRRDSPANLALLEFTDPAAHLEPASPEAEPAPEEAGWERLALFRFPGGVAAAEARPDLVLLPATTEEKRIRLGAGVDPSAWGTPLISPAGIVGVVQNETNGLILEEVLRALELEQENEEKAPEAPGR
ncbi:MAG: hypothetical protein V3R29_06355 [Candidatus Acidoferrales bacterium]